MDASLLPVSLPTRSSVVARTAARTAPLILLAGIAAFVVARNAGYGGAVARGFSEAVPLSVAPTTAGRLVELSVSVGQAVKAGDVIGRLDGRALELERQRLAAEQALLQAKLLAETSRQEDAVMRAEVWRLRTVAGSHHDQASLAVLDKELQRLNGLLENKLVKASDVEPVRRQREALAARVGTFERARTAGQAGLVETRDRVGADKHDAVVQVRTAPLREALHVSQAEMALVELKIAGLALRAPADGVVSVINRRPGEVLAAAEPAVVVIVHRPGVFEVYIPAREGRVPSVGAAVRLSRGWMFSRGVPGRVVEVAPTIVELPVRLRSSSNAPVWGRRIVVDASASEVMRAVPAGEEVKVRI